MADERRHDRGQSDEEFDEELPEEDASRRTSIPTRSKKRSSRTRTTPSSTEDETFEDEEKKRTTPRRRPLVGPTAPAGEDEDDDEDMLTPDDVEADLDTILKDRLVTAEETERRGRGRAEPDDPRTDPGDRLQPKRADEQLCSTLLPARRAKAPGCPMGDDTCPIFAD